MKLSPENVRTSLSSAAPEFTLRGLRYFLSVVETGTIVDAAKRMGASPSAVSQQISGLERIIGSNILDRSARPLTLTPAGMILQWHARQIVDAVNKARSELVESDLSCLPELKLAIIDDLDASITPALVMHLESIYPKTALFATSGRSDSLVAAFERRNADIAVISEMPSTLSNIDVFPLLTEPFVVVTKKGTINQGDDILDQLTRRPLVQYNETMPMGRRITEHLKRMKINVSRQYAFDASRSVFAMVLNNAGWAITTPLCIFDNQRFSRELDVLPLPFAGFSRTISMIARSGETGKLPQMLANRCRDLVRQQVLPKIDAFAPWLSERISVFENAKEPNQEEDQ